MIKFFFLFKTLNISTFNIFNHGFLSDTVFQERLYETDANKPTAAWLKAALHIIMPQNF